MTCAFTRNSIPKAVRHWVVSPMHIIFPVTTICFVENFHENLSFFLGSECCIRPAWEWNGYVMQASIGKRIVVVWRYKLAVLSWNASKNIVLSYAHKALFMWPSPVLCSQKKVSSVNRSEVVAVHPIQTGGLLEPPSPKSWIAWNSAKLWGLFLKLSGNILKSWWGVHQHLRYHGNRVLPLCFSKFVFLQLKESIFSVTNWISALHLIEQYFVKFIITVREIQAI